MQQVSDKERLKKRKENRWLFLRRVYDLTQGRRNAMVNVFELGDELGFAPEEADDAAQYLRDEGLLEYMAMEWVCITPDGVRTVEASIDDSDPPTEPLIVPVINNNYYEPVVHQHGAKNTANVANTSHATISHSDGAAVAVGPGAIAKRELGEDGVVSKEEFVAWITAAQKAWVDDQGRMSDDVSDALWDILRRRRHLEFAVASVSQLQQMIKETVDDMAVDSIVAKLKGDEARALGVIRALLESPVTAELVKSWLGG